jgi:hypothetical protein
VAMLWRCCGDAVAMLWRCCGDTSGWGRRLYLRGPGPGWGDHTHVPGICNRRGRLYGKAMAGKSRAAQKDAPPSGTEGTAREEGPLGTEKLPKLRRNAALVAGPRSAFLGIERLPRYAAERSPCDRSRSHPYPVLIPSLSRPCAILVRSYAHPYHPPPAPAKHPARALFSSP